MSVSPIISDSSIPSSFTPSVDRPFDPIGVRTMYENEMQAGRSNERLTDAQIQELTRNPQISKNTRLQDLSDTENERRLRQSEGIKIYNLSLLDLAHRTSDTVHNVMDELLDFDPKDGTRGIIDIFTRSDRLVYIGILIILFTIIILLIKTTD